MCEIPCAALLVNVVHLTCERFSLRFSCVYDIFAYGFAFCSSASHSDSNSDVEPFIHK